MEIDKFRKKWKEAQENGLFAAMITFPVGAERQPGDKVIAKACEKRVYLEM